MPPMVTSEPSPKLAIGTAMIHSVQSAKTSSAVCERAT